jgi:hypothetical protein
MKIAGIAGLPGGRHPVLPGPDKPLLPLQTKITAILAPLTATPLMIYFFAISLVQLQFCTLMFSIQHTNLV